MPFPRFSIIRPQRIRMHRIPCILPHHRDIPQLYIPRRVVSIIPTVRNTYFTGMVPWRGAIVEVPHYPFFAFCALPSFFCAADGSVSA